MVPTDFLMNIQMIMKLHDSILKEICEKYQMTLIEAKIISFLHNNPGKDTAADIVELRMLQKGNVSQAVDVLFRKSLLIRRQDGEDRRRIHLTLTKQADSVVNDIKKIQNELKKEIFSGLSEDEIEVFFRVNGKIKENTQKVLKGGEETERR
ncbi:MAG: MarR family winged helix-turn-helix transcriptional regulator [Ruminococcus sp.]|jgi:DNA-binding MarR family transcriptional regulator